MDYGGDRRWGTIASAQDAAYRLADRVIIPNVRFRRDIGSKLIAEGLHGLNILTC